MNVVRSLFDTQKHTILVFLEIQANRRIQAQVVISPLRGLCTQFDLELTWRIGQDR